MVTQYPLRHATIAKSIRQIIVFNIFVPGEINLVKMAQKMKTYNEMSTTKGHNWVPQESQDFVLSSAITIGYTLISCVGARGIIHCRGGRGS